MELVTAYVGKKKPLLRGDAIPFGTKVCIITGVGGPDRYVNVGIYKDDIICNDGTRFVLLASPVPGRQDVTYTVLASDIVKVRVLE